MARVDAIRRKRTPAQVGAEIEAQLDAIPDIHERRHTYGQLGGEGPTRGKKASTYEGFTSDNEKITKRSFRVHTPTAFIAIYKHGGKWQASGVRETPEDWGTQIWIPATRKG